MNVTQSPGYVDTRRKSATCLRASEGQMLSRTHYFGHLRRCSARRNPGVDGAGWSCAHNTKEATEVTTTDDQLSTTGSDDAPTDWSGTEEQLSKALEFMENIVRPGWVAFDADYD